MQREYGLAPTSQAAKERLHTINETFAVLSNQKKRAEYDSELPRWLGLASFPQRKELNVYVGVPAKTPEKEGGVASRE